MPSLSIASLPTAPVMTTTDQVFELLHNAIISFDLPPGSKMSEAEVSAQMGVSRQPVRDAFFRLSELGFLQIRPQRATRVSKISEEAVNQAAFVRAALELACLKEAIDKMTDAGIKKLDNIISEQADAVAVKDRVAFHELDDAFHHALCNISGRAHVWTLIKEHKAHMDRARYLSLPFSLDIAYSEHLGVMDAIRARDYETSQQLMGDHLSRITKILGKIRDEHAEFFEEPGEDQSKN